MYSYVHIYRLTFPFFFFFVLPQNASTETTTESDLSTSTAATQKSTDETDSGSSESGLTESTSPIPVTTEKGETGEPLKRRALPLLMFNSSYFSEINPNAVLSMSPSVCIPGNNGHDICRDLHIDDIPRPVYEGGMCVNGVVGVSYVFQHNGTEGISSFKAKIYLANISDAQNHVRQSYSVKYEWSSPSNISKNVFQRSGRPGYMQGKPLLLGKLVKNLTEGKII